MRVAACKGILPFDVSFSASHDFIFAWVVVAGEIEGEKFDWSTLTWRERK